MTSETRTTTVTMPSDREVRITRSFDATRELMFEVHTNPKHVPQWMLGPADWTMPVCEMDLREGGQWHYVWRKANGEEMSMTGTFREISPPSRIVHTECWGGDFPETVNTTEFTEEGGRTVCTMTILYPSKEARDAAAATGMQDGADMSYARLDDYLRTIA